MSGFGLKQGRQTWGGQNAKRLRKPAGVWRSGLQPPGNVAAAPCGETLKGATTSREELLSIPEPGGVGSRSTLGSLKRTESAGEESSKLQ
jgi:hypothetical protein